MAEQLPANGSKQCNQALGEVVERPADLLGKMTCLDILDMHLINVDIFNEYPGKDAKVAMGKSPKQG